MRVGVELLLVVATVLLLFGVVDSARLGKSEELSPERGLGQSSFIFLGQLGVVAPQRNVQNFLRAARSTLMVILKKRAGATGIESLIPGELTSLSGEKHIRFTEEIRNIPVEGMSVMMHVDANGNVYAVNGDFVSSLDVEGYNVTLTCKAATKQALRESGIANGSWASKSCNEKAIMNDYQGQTHVTWKRDVVYNDYQRDTLYASTMTGDLIARIPQVITNGVLRGIRAG